MRSPPRLWHFRLSHYNEKVRWALDFKGCHHHRIALAPGFHIPRARWLSGQNKVPILELDGHVVWDSTRILEALERACPEPRLYPPDAEARARVEALEAHFDDHVAPDVRRLFWSTYLPDLGQCARLAADGFGAPTYWSWLALSPALRVGFRRNIGVGEAEVAGARARLAGHFDRLEAEIGQSGFLVGDRFTAADLTAAAVMTAIIRPPQFSYPLPEPWPPALVSLRDSVAERPGFQWVQRVYAEHRGPSAALTDR